MWVMGEWSVGQWIVGVISFQKMYGLYGLKHHIVEISGDVTDAGRTNEQQFVEYFKQIFKMQTFGNGKYARQNYMWTSITLVCHADDGVMTFNPPSVLGTNPTFL